ncbi:uncharacterized protein LOC124537757 [Vanessa cardui]|uniref:uncharacterized protein LOC124537757 n=1 Tax=Vanessa cardui TaxID=171605 RepID=UPI001F13A497|nr:uncharacterized protein LOC124537757 [Vanessa cardui]
MTIERKKTWKCPDCSASLKGGDNTLTPVRQSCETQNVTFRKKQDTTLTPTTDSSSTELKELTSEIRLLTQEISSLKQRLEDATLSLSHCHERLDELASSVVTNNSRIKNLEDREQEVVNLKATVSLMQREINTQAEMQLRNEFELSGIPERTNESLRHTVLLAARKIGVELEDCDIDWVTRAGPRTKSENQSVNETRLPRPVVVRLLRRRTRDQILKASKSRRNLTSSDLEITGNPLKVYFNERLTKENRMLFREARTKSKEKGYAHCWSN